MKKIYLTLALALLAMATYADQKVVFLGSRTLDWNSDFKIPSAFFANAEEGDVITVETNAWTKLCNNYGEKWTELKVGDPEDGKVQYAITAEALPKLQGDGLIVQVNGTVTRIYVGSPTSTVLSDTETNLGDWTGQIELPATAFSDATAGDELVITFKEEVTDGQVQIQDENWNGIEGLDHGGLTGVTSTTFTLTAAQVVALQSGLTRVRGTNATVSTVTLLHNSFVYVLSSSDPGFVTLADIPADADVDVQFLREFSWGWNTVCLPFATTPKAISADGRAFEYKSYAEGVITLSETETMEAGRPYLVNIDNGDTKNVTFNRVTIEATTAESQAETDGLTFKGTFEEIDMQGKYGLFYDNSSSDWVIGKGSAGSSLNAFCAYFEGDIDIAAGSKGLALLIDETNDVQSIATGLSPKRHVYNMQGQLLTPSDISNDMSTPLPTTKGIIIVNGKKMIVK
ncbi:MAG: hypothetical protein IJR71_03775 [Prevotella sp.]|nr:hypothetical protein [Prevotella sp.]